MLVYLVAGAIIALLIAAFMSRMRNRAHTVAAAGSREASPAGELGRFVKTLNSVNSQSDPAYVAGIQQLRARKEEVLSEARRILSESAAAHFSLRHSSVLAVAALRDPSALDLLAKVALNPQPLPPKEVSSRHDEHMHEAEDVVQGTVIALDAVEGLEMLADDGHLKALDALVEVARVNSNALRAAALTALRARADRQEYFARAESALPQDLGHLAHLRRADVKDVPQISRSSCPSGWRRAECRRRAAFARARKIRSRAAHAGSARSAQDSWEMRDGRLHL